VAKSFECRHAGVLCRARITGESEDEVLRKAVEHAREKHGVDLTRSKTLAGYAASLIRDESERPAEAG
jgi:predicted small metal-binding protein